MANGGRRYGRQPTLGFLYIPAQPRYSTCSMIEQKKAQDRKEGLLENEGKLWTREQDDALLDMICFGLSIDEMKRSLSRSERSIRARRDKLAARNPHNGRDYIPITRIDGPDKLTDGMVHLLKLAIKPINQRYNAHDPEYIARLWAWRPEEVRLFLERMAASRLQGFRSHKADRPCDLATILHELSHQLARLAKKLDRIRS